MDDDHVADTAAEEPDVALRRLSLIFGGIAVLLVAVAALAVALIVANSNDDHDATTLPSFGTPVEACDAYWQTVMRGVEERWTNKVGQREMAVVAQRTEAIDSLLATSLREMSSSSAPFFVASFSRMVADRCITVHGWSGPTEDERRRFEAATASR